MITPYSQTGITCPCCSQSVVLPYDICDVCGWENDVVQLKHPDTGGGANTISLNEARKAYKEGKKVY